MTFFTTEENCIVLLMVLKIVKIKTLHYIYVTDIQLLLSL